jgi:hypothetical protein
MRDDNPVETMTSPGCCSLEHLYINASTQQYQQIDPNNRSPSFFVTCPRNLCCRCQSFHKPYIIENAKERTYENIKINL